MTPSPLLLLLGGGAMRQVVKFVPGRDNKPIARSGGRRGKVILPCRGWTPRVGEEWEVELEEKERYYIAYPLQPVIESHEYEYGETYKLVTKCGDVVLKEELPERTEEEISSIDAMYAGLIRVTFDVHHVYSGNQRCSGHPYMHDRHFDDIKQFLAFVEKNREALGNRVNEWEGCTLMEKALRLVRDTIRNWEVVEKNLPDVAQLFGFSPEPIARFAYRKPLCDKWEESSLSALVKEQLPSQYAPLADIIAHYLLHGIPKEFPPSPEDVQKAIQFYSNMNMTNVEKTFEEFYGLALEFDWDGLYVTFQSREEMEKHLPALRLFTTKEPDEEDGKYTVWLSKLRLY